jgi:predicted flap endonuclease-1-like 5' DNA nuclease
LETVENYLSSSIEHKRIRERENRMRSDYALYTVAIIFFVLTGLVFAVPEEQIGSRPVWVVATAVLGLLFLGLGYSQRLKPHVKAVEVSPPAPPMPIEVRVEEKPVAEKVTPPPTVELTRVKGIKEKRAGQLRALGITNAEDLAKASAKDLAAKMKISPKIVRRWIEEAKKLLEKS